MRRLPIAGALAVMALVGVAVWGTASGSVASRVAPVRVATAPITSATLVCPDINGEAIATSTTAVAADLASALSPPSQSSGTVTATVLARKKSKKTALSLVPVAFVSSRPKTDQTVSIGASGSVAASLVADQVGLTSTGRYRGLYGVGCAAPSTDWWFAGTDGRVGFTDVLTIANPAPIAAEVTISMWSGKGLLSTPSLESIRIRSLSTTHIKIASVAPDVGTLAVHVHATSGAVTAALIDRRTSGLLSDGADYIPATQPPARSAVVAGFASGSGARQLFLANPGTLDATVNLRLVTRLGSFAPAGDNQVVVPAGHTRVIILDRAFAGTTGAVEVTSDQPVVAEGFSVTSGAPHRPDLMWLAATRPLVGSAGIATGREPDGGHCLLLLTAPKAAAQVRVSTPSGQTSTISVPASRSVVVDITATIHPSAGQPGSGSWAFVVTSLGSAPVYGVRVLQFSGAHGALITDEPLVALPTPIVLPAVRRDPRIAMR